MMVLSGRGVPPYARGLQKARSSDEMGSRGAAEGEKTMNTTARSKLWGMRACCIALAGMLLALTAVADTKADKSMFGLPAEGQPEPGVLSAAQPSEEQLRELAEAGYRAIVNLRTDAEMTFDQRGLVESLGMEYYSIPVGAAEDVSEAGARRLDQILADVDGPALVHCASSNRVGALFAVRAALIEGASEEEALAKGRSAGLTSLEPRVREVIGAEVE
jgi:uncharacterized protein (TIGR01244 family)